jgi:hypothetical protein
MTSPRRVVTDVGFPAGSYCVTVNVESGSVCLRTRSTLSYSNSVTSGTENAVCSTAALYAVADPTTKGNPVLNCRFDLRESVDSPMSRPQQLRWITTHRVAPVPRQHRKRIRRRAICTRTACTNVIYDVSARPQTHSGPIAVADSIIVVVHRCTNMSSVRPRRRTCAPPVPLHISSMLSNAPITKANQRASCPRHRATRQRASPCTLLQ